MRLSGGPQETSYQIEDTVCSYGESAGFLKSLNISGEGDVLCLFQTVTLLITLLAKRFRFSLVFFFCVYLFVCVVWIFYTLKGPSQSQLCFCLHARVWLLYFIQSRNKGNHRGTTTDNQTHLPEHNLQ